MKIPRVIGHRGVGAYAPENTLISMKTAAALGLQWVEFDVMLTQDEALVIFHDETLERTTNGVGQVRKSSLRYIKSLDAGTWFGTAFARERVPTLREVMACCHALNLGMNIELKAVGGEEALLAAKVLDEILSAPKAYPPSLLLLSSFSEKTLWCLKELNCPFALAWNKEVWDENWQQQAEALGLFSLHFSAKTLTIARVAAVKSTGRRVLAFTVNNADEAKILFDKGVDAVFSDVGIALRE